jgi:hypothetical protein
LCGKRTKFVIALREYKREKTRPTCQPDRFAFVVAGYWGWAGDFLDFWDAFLWILAFVFIERSVFVWEKDKVRNSAQGVQA